VGFFCFFGGDGDGVVYDSVCIIKGHVGQSFGKASNILTIRFMFGTLQ